jgi:hypothetical protein
MAGMTAADRPDDQFNFKVHGTMADPRWLYRRSIPTNGFREPVIWAILKW